MFKCGCHRMKCDKGSRRLEQIKGYHISIFLHSAGQHVPPKINVGFAKVWQIFGLRRCLFPRGRIWNSPHILSGSCFKYWGHLSLQIYVIKCRRSVCHGVICCLACCGAALHDLILRLPSMLPRDLALSRL